MQFNDSENNCKGLSIFKIMNIYPKLNNWFKIFRLLIEIKYLIQRLLTHIYECRKSTLLCYEFYQYGEVKMMVLLVGCNPSSNLFSHVIIILKTTKNIAHGMSLWCWLIKANKSPQNTKSNFQSCGIVICFWSLVVLFQ